MLTYQEAKDMMATARNGRRKLANNTYLTQDGKDFLVTLRSTNVVCIHADGTFTLDSGGWQTLTTKDRINSFSPASVFQDMGIWYLGNWRERLGLFEDGMKVDSFGRPLVRIDPSEYERVKRKVDRMVSKYIKGYANHVVKNGLTDPGNGDCWYCLFIHSKKDVDHLLSHFEESYYVPSLLWNAINDRHYGDPALIWHMIKLDAQQGKTSHFLTDNLRYYFRQRKILLVQHLLQINESKTED